MKANLRFSASWLRYVNLLFMNITTSELELLSGTPAVLDGRVQLNTALLKKLRLERGLSQAKLAEQARENRQPLSIASIKRAELGEPVIYRTAAQLASLFNVAVHELLQAPSPSSALKHQATAQAAASAPQAAASKAWR